MEPIIRWLFYKKRVCWIVIISLPILLFIHSLTTFPDYKKFKYEYFKPSDGIVLDRNYYPLSEARTDFNFRQIGYARVKEVNRNFLNLLISSEDRRFYSHIGIDFISIASAIKDFIINKRMRGASTIDMQFIRNYMRLKNGNLIIRKIKEIYYSIILELRWEKDEILEAYLNTVPIRGEIVGIFTASLILFDKSPEFLNDIDSLILLSLIKKPSAEREKLTNIAKNVNKRFNLNIKEERLLDAINNLPDRYNFKHNYSYLPVLSDKLLIKYNSPVVTTIDIDIQKKAIEIVRSFVSQLKSRNLTDAALIVAENKSGEIVAYIPNSLEHSKAKYIDGITARRQAGSTLKPFLYEYLIERKVLTSASVLEDFPVFIGKNGSVYSPQNYDRTYKGYVSVRTALASSLNIPAIRAILLAGVDRYTSHLKEIGFEPDFANVIEDYYGESLALGTLDVSLLQLTRAYMMLANNGLYKDLKIRAGESSSERVLLDKRAVYIIKDILSDRDARSVTFDLENTLSTPFYTAVKTGTSKDMRDNWCVGFSDRYTVGVWTGNFSGEPMYNISGSHGASQIWFALMKELHKGRGSSKDETPQGLVKKKIKYEPEIEPERVEIFIKDTEPEDGIIRIVNSRSPSILYPPDKSIFAYDPEIPSGQQKLFVYTNCQKCSLIYDGEILKQEGGVFILDISKGRHILHLMDTLGNRIYSSEYEVR
ncbi:MAG: penicillin-binding protein 1C [Myxococcota bacterium]